MKAMIERLEFELREKVEELWGHKLENAELKQEKAELNEAQGDLEIFND